MGLRWPCCYGDRFRNPSRLVLGEVVRPEEPLRNCAIRRERMASAEVRQLAGGGIMRAILVAAVLLAGCSTSTSVPLPGIIAELSVSATVAMMNQRQAPDEPEDGCVKNCTCNGTGREKTGDGLDTVPCRCPDSCECKASALVPLPPKAERRSGRIECVGSECYWIDEVTGMRYRVVK